MTDMKAVEAALKSGTALPVPMTCKQLLQHVADHFAAQSDKQFVAPLKIENLTPAELREASVDGHIFSEVATALGTAGVQTDGKMGSVMDPLNMDQNKVHYFCACHDPEISGTRAANTFKHLADNTP